MRDGGAKVAVVGHVEWVQFARVEHVPVAGEVVHAVDPMEEPAGGGAVAAVQLARLAGGATLFTALGEDEYGHRSVARLRELGVEVRASFVASPTRRAVTLVDDGGERTITTFGPRLDPLGDTGDQEWEGLADLDAVYFTAGDVNALRRVRAATRVLVASPRARNALGHKVPLDALVSSREDAIEARELERVRDEASVVICTEGSQGGSYSERSGATGRWSAAKLTRPGGGFLRLRRLLCGGAHVRAGRWPASAGGAQPRGALWGDVPYGARVVRAAAGHERSLTVTQWLLEQDYGSPLCSRDGLRTDRIRHPADRDGHRGERPHDHAQPA